MHNFTKRQLLIIDSLKTRTIKETAKHLNMKRGAVDGVLFRIRNEINRAQGTVNLSTHWKNSKENPRLAKLLRRQEPPEKNDEP
jgi:hypothetical protein